MAVLAEAEALRLTSSVSGVRGLGLGGATTGAGGGGGGGGAGGVAAELASAPAALPTLVGSGWGGLFPLGGAAATLPP